VGTTKTLLFYLLQKVFIKVDNMQCTECGSIKFGVDAGMRYCRECGVLFGSY